MIEYQKVGPKTLLYLIIRSIGFGVIMFVFLLVLRPLLGTLPMIGTFTLDEETINTIFTWLYLSNAFVFIFLILVGSYQYHSYGFRIDDDSFKIRRGILTREEIAIPYRRIESVDLKAPLIFQLFNINHVTIELVSESEDEERQAEKSDDEVIPIIDHGLALTIQEALTSRANVQKMNIHPR